MPSGQRAPEPVVRSTLDRLGTRYSDYAGQDFSLSVKRIEIPDFPGTFAIWGGSGRTDVGTILLGVSTVDTTEAPQPSARVFAYNPSDSKLDQLGDVVSNLEQLGTLREANLKLTTSGKIDESGELTRCVEQQAKIHSKFVTMNDGWTYFASMDEWGENTNGSRRPYWGSHLWRMRGDQWQEVAAVPEGLIAVSGVGQYVFALGYFGHVLYRYDTQTGSLDSTKVGSYKGHISRNFLSDERGHAFVPRIIRSRNEDTPTEAELVEIDEQFQEVGSTRLDHYSVTGDDRSHGITGIAYLKNSRMAFTTADGHLYLITRVGVGASRVEPVGWLHPDGQAYAASLFPIDASRFVAGVVKTKTGFDWVVHDLLERRSSVMPLEIANKPDHGMKNVNLYGSNTRDDHGNFYLVGCYRNRSGSRQFPLCLRVSMVCE